jgi:hypothetical protein
LRVREVAVEGEVVADEDLVADRDPDRAGLVVRVPDADRDAHAVFLDIEGENAEHAHAVRRDRVLVLDDVETAVAEGFDERAHERGVRDRLVGVGGLGRWQPKEILSSHEGRAAVGNEAGDRPVGRDNFNFCHESLILSGRCRPTVSVERSCSHIRGSGRRDAPFGRGRTSASRTAFPA